MITKQQSTLIAKVWARVQLLDNIDWTPYAENLLQHCLQDEKQHDKLRPKECKRGMTLIQAAKYFACLEVCRGIIEPPPEVRNYTHIRKTCFEGWALGNEYQEQLQLDINDVRAIIDLDYAQMNKGE